MDTKQYSGFAQLKSYFQKGHTRQLAFRLQALTTLENLIVQNQEEICLALYQDLGKPKQEALISEIAVTLEEIRLTKKKLKKWMKPRCVGSGLSTLPSRNRIHFEPLGVVLIIGPWNYPFQLAIAPLVGAIAAGNCAVIKPSELAPKTSGLIAELIQQSFPADFIRVELGGIPETSALLATKFDHIFFTGSTPVGRIVMEAAAKNLVPVTLELGGKSPAIVCADADLELTARRLVWGKFYNAGQTCVAPDYVYVDKAVVSELIKKIKKEIAQQFGEDPKESESLGRIVNSRNLQRLVRMMDAKKTVHGGEVDEKQLYIAPTVMADVSWQDPVMQEEIFGPILPVLTFGSLEEVWKQVGEKPKPLAAYFFSGSTKNQKSFVQELSFGGGCINDVVLHLSNPYLPFGGVGDSGMGSYHGEKSFHTFSHAKSVMTRWGFLDLSARYAPYSDRKLRFLRRIFGL